MNNADKILGELDFKDILRWIGDQLPSEDNIAHDPEGFSKIRGYVARNSTISLFKEELLNITSKISKDPHSQMPIYNGWINLKILADLLKPYLQD